ncbi:hypothetical protein LINPERHAP1_LOCUS8549 [Linum perenne]
MPYYPRITPQLLCRKGSRSWT